jgi:hypothetical protein
MCTGWNRFRIKTCAGDDADGLSVCVSRNFVRGLLIIKPILKFLLTRGDPKETGIVLWWADPL